MNGISSIRLTPDFDAAISRHAQKLSHQTVRKRAFLKSPRPPAPHAADGEYPFTNPANAGMRRKFDLPLDRPLNP
jgi:hypothetical protein